MNADTKHRDLVLDVAFGTTTGKKVTHWRNDQIAWRKVLTWADRPTARTKEQAGSYVFGRLRPTPDLDHSKTGCTDPCQKIHRNREAVEFRTAIPLDVDHAPADFPERVAALGIEALLHTTASSTPDDLRLRLIVPLGQRVRPDDFTMLADELMRLLARDGDPEDMFDRTSNQASRLMYKPAAPDPTTFQSWHFGGDLLDVPTLLVDAALERDEEADRQPVAPEADMSTDATEAEREKATSILAKATSRAPDLLNPDGHAHGDTAPGRNQWVTNWATILLAFAKGGCLDRQHVEDTLWEATLLVPGDDEWDRDEFDGVCESVWGYVLPTRPRGLRPEDDFTPVPDEPGEPVPPKPDLLYEESDISGDAHLAKRVALGLQKTKHPLAAWGKSGWARWDGKRWDLWFPDDKVRRLVRDALLKIRKTELDLAVRKMQDAMDAAPDDAAEDAARRAFNKRLSELQRLRNASVIDMAMKHSRSDLSVRLEDFDGPDTRHWLNVGNGMVDLRTGLLRPHDPEMRFTKVSPVRYDPDARHPDWDKALAAMPPATAEWMQVRFGQAATGFSPPDDVVPFLFGGGENGKTTVFTGITSALGEFYVRVPEKAMLKSSLQEHDALFMVFKGARLAIIEELPGDKWLDDERLKKIVGSEGMTGRYMRENYVQWDPTHTLMVSTNHETQVAETDHGTWRRLARVGFPYTFDGSDPDHPRDGSLRERLKAGKDGQHEAALAWMVAGAVQSYATPLSRDGMPEQIRKDTHDWRARGNAVVRFVDTCLVYDPESAVLSSQVYAAYRNWARDTGQTQMNDQTFWRRVAETALFKSPGVEKTLARVTGWKVDSTDRLDTGKKHRVVLSLRFSDDGRSLALGFSEIG